MEKADFALIISLSGLFISGGSLYVANNQRVIAENTYNNALNQTKIQTRAYVVTHGAQLLSSSAGEKQTIRVQLKNAGTTPARNVRIFSNLYYANPLEPSRVLGAPDPYNFGSILPGGEGGGIFLQTQQPADAAELDGIRSGQTALRAVMRITYDTAFEKDEYYDICFQTSSVAPELSTTSLSLCPQ